MFYTITFDMNIRLELTKTKVIVDDFRISHIFDIEDPVPERTLTEALQRHQYKVINDRVISHPPIRAVILNLATKNNVNIVYQKESIPAYIGTAGRDMHEVFNQFDILNNILSQIDPTLHGRHVSTEMILSTKVFGDLLPNDTITKLAKSDNQKFSKLFGKPLQTLNITMQDDDRTSESYNSIHIAPLYRSPRYYFVQLVHRSKDLSEVVSFAKKGEQVIKDAVSILEQ
jgi:hypothetical protein